MHISDLHARKRKATFHSEIPSALEDQAITFKGQSIVGGILVLSTPCYELDVPCEKGISCHSSSGVSLLMNRVYGWKVA